MKIVFMGTPEFSVPTLKALIASEHEVLAVVTQPDKPVGRGNKVTYPPVKEVALANNLPVYQPEKVKAPDFMDQMKALAPDVIVVIAFGQILKKELLDLPKFGCINVHASLLPKYRGAGPIQWSIIHGEEETGITTMYMGIGLDTGDMIYKDIIPIDKKETGGSLHDKLSELGAQTLMRTLKSIEEGTAPREQQVEEEACYAPMLDKAMGRIQWEKDAKTIEQLIRGLNPWPSAYTTYEGKLLKLWSAEVVPLVSNHEAGQIVQLTDGKMIVQTGKEGLAITELQLEGKKRMTTEAFLRGYNIQVGYKLGQE